MWKPYVFFIALSEIVGLLAGLLTKGGMAAYQLLEKPPLTPPDIIFPIVWSILYALMGISAARIRLTSPTAMRSQSIKLFLIQLAANFIWSIIFFHLQAFGFAFIWLIFLWILILLMILSYWKIDKTAALLQIPYLLWVTFAGYLNFMVWMLQLCLDRN